MSQGKSSIKLKMLEPRLSKPDRIVGFAEQMPAPLVRGTDPRKKSPRWKRLRKFILARDYCKCAICGRIEANPSLLVVDHIKPHRGDDELFWNESNMRLVHKSWHDRVKQRQEQSSLHTRGIWY